MAKKIFQKWSPAKRAVSKFKARHRLHTFVSPEKTDIVIAGFPKSGNTWMQSILSGLQCGVDASVASDTIIQDLVPDLHVNRVGRRHSGMMFFKSHHMPRADFRKVIHLVRDGRDVLVSYYHFRRALGYKGSMRELMFEDNALYRDWRTHAKQWIENPYDAEYMLLRYEDLLANPEHEFSRICQFAGLTVDTDRMKDVVRWSNFKSLRQKEDRIGGDNPDWPKEHNFFRRGKRGSYLDEMDGETLDEFLNLNAETMETLGYS